MLQPLIHHFESYIPFKGEEKELLQGRFVQRSIKRRQAILQEGFTCKHYSFVVQGCFKMYGVDKKGIEHNLQFAAENDWIADIGSFHSGKPSKLFIEAIDPSVILQIEKQIEEDQTKRNYLHIKPGTPGFDLGAGLFTK